LQGGDEPWARKGCQRLLVGNVEDDVGTIPADKNNCSVKITKTTLVNQLGNTAIYQATMYKTSLACVTLGVSLIDAPAPSAA